jgi:hypothetical protein
MTYQLLKIGSDAEFFLTNPSGQAVAVCGLLGGTKEEPRPVLGGNGYAVQEDNVTAEFNIPPASTSEEFALSITKMLEYLREEFNQKQLTCVYRSELPFLTENLSHEKAHQFGCEPDFCVWTRSVNSPPRFDTLLFERKARERQLTGELRAAGFHIHTSYLVDGEPPQLEHQEFYVKMQDVYLAVPLLAREIYVIGQAGALPQFRRAYYGRAGAFRPKEYGHEYRVLGSSSLSMNVELNKWIFETNARIIDMMNTRNSAFEEKLDENAGIIDRAINRYHTDYIQHIMSNFQVAPLPAHLVTA